MSKLPLSRTPLNRTPLNRTPLNRTPWIVDADIEWEILDEYCKRKIMAYTDGLMIVKVHFKKGVLADSFNPMRADFIQ